MNPVQYILILLVRVYRVTLSPAKTFLFGPAGQCRFEPSCSRYAIEALKTHGALAGGLLAAKRVCRCHPWGECGEDAVPPVNSKFQIPNFKGSTSQRAIDGPTFRVSAFAKASAVAKAMADRTADRPNSEFRT